jgi:O-antigen/teichoic acid export membrane protein
MDKIEDFIKRKFSVDFDYIKRNGGLITASHIFGTGCGFIITLLLANFIDTTTYGQYKYAISVASIIGSLSLTGAGSALLQSTAKGYGGSYAYEQRLTIKWGAPAVFLSLAVGIYYLLNEDLVLGTSVALMGIIGYAQSIFLLHTSYLNGKCDFKRLSRNQILTAIVNLGGVGLAILLGFTSVIWLIIAYNGSQLLFQFFASRHTKNIYRPLGEVGPEEMKLSRHLSIGNIIPFVSEYLDKILIFQLLGPYQLALYAFAVGIPDQLRSINKILSAIAIPKLNPKGTSALRASVIKHTKTYVFISTLIMVAFWLIAEPFYEFFFPQYAGSAHYAMIYSLILPVIASGIFFGHALQIENRIAPLYSIRLIDSCTKIILYILFIPKFGILGAILAVLIAKTASTLTQIVFYRLPKDASTQR